MKKKIEERHAEYIKLLDHRRQISLNFGLMLFGCSLISLAFNVALLALLFFLASLVGGIYGWYIWHQITKTN